MLNHNEEPKVDEILEGDVIEFFDWGALIEFSSGHCGHLENEEVSWTKGLKAHEVLSIGQSVKIIIKKITHDEKKNKLFIKLGYKELTEDPWTNIEKKFPINKKISATVLEFLPYGIKVRVNTKGNYVGLVHISELSWKDKHLDPTVLFNIGDCINLIVIRTDSNKQHINFSYRLNWPDPWTKSPFPLKVGNKIHGVIETQVEYGFFIKIQNTYTALLHKSKTQENWNAEKGDKISATIESIDITLQKISLVKPILNVSLLTKIKRKINLLRKPGRVGY